MPVAMSTMETPTRPGCSGAPVTEAMPELGLDQKIVRLARGIGAMAAITRDGAADQAWMATAQFLRSEARARGRPGRQVLDIDVRPGNHAGQQHRIVRLLEVEHDGFLATVQPDEVAALALGHRIVPAGEITLGALDLDDPGTGIGQPAGTERCRHRLLQGHHQNSIESAQPPHRAIVDIVSICSLNGCRVNKKNQAQHPLAEHNNVSIEWAKRQTARAADAAREEETGNLCRISR